MIIDTKNIDVSNFEIRSDEDEGVLELMQRTLAFELIKPVSISGYLDEFQSSIEFKMENGDTVKWEYDEDVSRMKILKNYIQINGGEKITLEDDYLYEIRDIYRDHLKSKLGIAQ